MFQMGMYSFLIDRGFVFEQPYTVVGSFYYIAKTFDRSMGMKVTDSTTELFDLEKVKNSQLSLEEKEGFYSELLSNFVEIIKNINKGHFEPSPKDYKTCKTCKWRRICRAQHLM